MKIGFLSHLDQNLYLFRLPIMKALIKEGHEVYAICPIGDFFYKFEKEGIVAISYEISRKSLNPFKELKTIVNLKVVLQGLQLNILHTFTAKPNIYGTIAGRFAKIPVIFNLVEGLGSFYIEDNFKSFLLRNLIESLYKLVFRYSDKVVFVNEDDPSYLMDKKVISKEKVLIIKSVGVDTKEFCISNMEAEKLDSLRKELKLQDEIIVLMISRAIWHKGISEYYEAAELFKGENIRFILVGGIDDGNPSCADESFLQEGAVQWLGERDDIKELIAVSDIFVLPSYYREGIPRTLLEAAAMQRPIVTTNNVGCKEVVKDGENGFLIPIRDSKELFEKISKLVDDKDLREKMGLQSRYIAENMFDVQVVVEQYLELYNRSLNV